MGFNLGETAGPSPALAMFIFLSRVVALWLFILLSCFGGYVYITRINDYMIKEDRSHPTDSCHVFRTNAWLLLNPFRLSLLFTIHSCLIKHLRNRLCHVTTLSKMINGSPLLHKLNKKLLMAPHCFTNA